MNKTLNAIVCAVAFVYLFFTSSILISQTFPYYHYTTKEGLPNSVVSSIIQDKTGFMWFATEGGLSRFDGYSFTNFNENHGLNSNVITALLLSEDGSIYIGHLKEGISIYKNNEISKYEIKNLTNLYIRDFLMLNDTIFIGDGFGVNFISQNEMSKYFKKDVSKEHFINIYSNIFKDSKNNLLAGSRYGLYLLKNREAEKIEISNFKDSIIWSIAEDYNHNLWIGAYGKIYELNNYNIVKTIELDDSIRDYVNKLFIDSDGDIWFWIRSKGFYCIENNKLYNVGAKIQLDNNTVSSIFEDNQKNVWVSTQGKGVYCFYNDFIMNYNKTDGLLHNVVNSIMSLDDDGCLVGTTSGLNLFKNGKFEKITPSIDSNAIFNVSQIKKTNRNSYIISGGIIPQAMKNSITPVIYNNIQLIFERYFRTYQIDSASFIFGSSTNKLYFKNIYNKEIYDTITLKDSITTHNYVFDIEMGKDGSLMAGTDYGLFILKDNLKRTYENNPVLSNSIYKIFHLQDDNYFISGLKGIAILKDKEIIITYTKGPNYDFSFSYSFAIDNDKNLWIGSNRALYVVPLDSFLNNNLNSIRKFDETTGFPFEGCYITYNKKTNCLYTGTNTGVNVINLNRIQDFYTVPQKVNFIDFELSDTVFYCNNDIVLNPDQNNFVFHFASFNYRSPNSITYEYQIGNDNKWEETKINKINFTSLSSGDFKLLMRARDINGIKGDISELNFTIRAPFWKTIWFNTGVIICFVFLVAFVSYKRIKYIQKKSRENLEIQKNISSLKHLALSASLNPHFIFNTLNSIQYYIKEHSPEEANKYLVNFSRLIRMNLDLAGNTFILLKKELERLELYMRYEKLRFENRMDYYVNIDENINPDKLEIPNMILQPFVENSIWHGILNKESRGIIEINISKKEQVISGENYPVIDIEITDNGIGLEESKKYKKSKHISKGVAIIKDRLNLLAPETKDFDFVTIKDRTDGIQGAIVNITLLPKQYNIIE